MANNLLLEAVTNREDWDDTFELRDENNALIDLTGATIVVALADRETKRPVLTVSTDNSMITIDGLGLFSVHAPVANMRSVRAETYNVGGTLKLNGATKQLHIGTIPVLDGVVP